MRKGSAPVPAVGAAARPARNSRQSCGWWIAIDCANSSNSDTPRSAPRAITKLRRENSGAAMAVASGTRSISSEDPTARARAKTAVHRLGQGKARNWTPEVSAWPSVRWHVLTVSAAMRHAISSPDVWAGVLNALERIRAAPAALPASAALAIASVATCRRAERIGCPEAMVFSVVRPRYRYQSDIPLVLAEAVEAAAAVSVVSRRCRVGSPSSNESRTRNPIYKQPNA